MIKVNIPLKTYDDIEEVLVHNTHYNNVKIALYFVEDCNIRTSEMEVCISLIKRWLNGENVGRDLRIAGNKVIETIICRPALPMVKNDGFSVKRVKLVLILIVMFNQ